eukprot:CAMPEP_0196996028 /NCGR_PEP_ID=MMETSP1380-20130617/2017_1 /TAXON_ID=5936 /ORGANISM="Euplotes crassus, Strain CT5" /LENGTH=289 /DNA_ID=CAMNT_0042411875 /DNA_START=13 /DNA_END=882 /DNA_ORIENTATION=+
MESTSEESKSTDIRWNICVDGSDICVSAFNTVFKNLRKSDDYTIITHVSNDSKTYLDMKYKPDIIKQDYESWMIGLHSSKWELVFHKKESGLTTQEQIVELSENYRSDILVLGYHGRKGAKEDPTLLGSNVDLMAQNPVCPLLVIKREENREDKENKGFRFVVCIDGRTKSYKALNTVTQVMDKEKDEVIVLTVSREVIDTEAVKERTSGFLDEAGVKNHHCELLEREFDERYFEALIDYINVDDTPYVDFVVLANRGIENKHYSKDKYLGKVAKEVLFQSKANVLLVT